MLINFNSPSNLIATEILAGSHVLLYGTTNNLELDCVTDNTTLLDIQACNFNRWTLDIVRDLSTPGDPLIHRDITSNIATGSRIYIEVSLTNAACYAYMAGNSSVPVVFSLKGYESSEETVPGCVIQLPMAIRTTVNETLPLADDQLSPTSDRPVENRVIWRALRRWIPDNILDQLARVALTGNYYDLINRPDTQVAYNSEITVKVNGSSVSSFTVNQNHPSNIDIAVPTQLSQLSEDATHRTVTNAQVQDWNARLRLVIVNGTTSTVDGGTATLKIETGDPNAIKAILLNGTAVPVSSNTATMTIDTKDPNAVVHASAMPAITQELDGKVVVYTGQTTDTFAEGHIYQAHAGSQGQPGTWTDLTPEQEDAVLVYSSLPAPTQDTAGQTCIYTGEDYTASGTTYRKGCHYYCTMVSSNPDTYGWLPMVASNVLLTDPSTGLIPVGKLPAAATQQQITARSSAWAPITPGNLNVSVVSAITDGNHITLTDPQLATAKQVFDIPTAIRFNGSSVPFVSGTASLSAVTGVLLDGTTATLGNNGLATVNSQLLYRVSDPSAVPSVYERGRIGIYSSSSTSDFTYGEHVLAKEAGWVPFPEVIQLPDSADSQILQAGYKYKQTISVPATYRLPVSPAPFAICIVDAVFTAASPTYVFYLGETGYDQIIPLDIPPMVPGKKLTFLCRADLDGAWCVMPVEMN